MDAICAGSQAKVDNVVRIGGVRASIGFDDDLGIVPEAHAQTVGRL